MVKTSTLAIILAALIISVAFTAEVDGAGLVKRAISTAGTWPYADFPAKVVFTNRTNTYENAFVQTFSDDDIRIADSANNHFYTFSTGDLAADRVISLPVLGSADVFVFEAASQTLTTKTISADSNTITNIDDNEIKAAAAIDATKLADGSVTSTEFQFINTLSSNAQTQLDSKFSATNRQTAIVNSEITSVDTAKITTGTMATARLGSGIANSTTYLKGNQQYSTITDNHDFLNAGIAAGAGAPWTNMPSAITDLLNSTSRRHTIDTSTFNQFRINGGYSTVGATSSIIGLQYSVDAGTTWKAPNNGTAAKISNPNIGIVTPAAPETKITAWTNLTSEAKAVDVLWRIAGSNGNGAADPAITFITVQFR